MIVNYTNFNFKNGPIRSNLIKAFERGEDVEHIKGSGLGLSIAYAAAQRIHAQIMLYNNEDVAETTAEVILSNKGICQKTLF